MARGTKIEWATATWNPFIGCTKVSPACDNCYAEGWAKRCGRDFSRVSRAAAGTFYAPTKWEKPERIFVCSLSDFFHPSITDADRCEAWQVMRMAQQHTYMLLTKRPELIVPSMERAGWPMSVGLPHNIWVGVTVENQEQADRRVPHLLQVPARVRFASCEPLLGSVDLRAYMANPVPYDPYGGGKISWVICGGESGAHARPMYPEWARSLRDQCVAAGVPFMFKQWGEWMPVTRDADMRVRMKDDPRVHLWPDVGWESPVSLRVGKVMAGRLLDGREHLAVPA